MPVNRIVPNEITPLEPHALCQGLAMAWRGLLGAPATRGSILTLAAQIAHETGLKSCHCNNLGNFKWADGDPHDLTMFRCWELEHGVKVWYDPPHRATWFRAYPTLSEAMVDYLAFLRKRYAFAWPHVVDGDPGAFCKALKVAHYFTDDEEVYEHDVRRYFLMYATLPFETEWPGDDPAMVARVDILVGASLRELAVADTMPPPPAELVPPENRETKPEIA